MTQTYCGDVELTLADRVKIAMGRMTFRARPSDEGLVALSEDLVAEFPELRQYGLSALVDAIATECESRICGAP